MEWKGAVRTTTRWCQNSFKNTSSNWNQKWVLAFWTSQSLGSIKLRGWEQFARHHITSFQYGWIADFEIIIHRSLANPSWYFWNALHQTLRRWITLIHFGLLWYDLSTLIHFLATTIPLGFLDHLLWSNFRECMKFGFLFGQ